MSEPLRVLSLFAGIGGFDLGLERTGGFKTVAFCEIDPWAQSVLKKHWPKVPIYGDVRELTAKRLATDGIAVDTICGGFPCQDLSSSGKQGGISAGRSGLWSEQARLVGEIRPKFVLIENVTNLLAGNSGAWFATVLADLASVGYDAEWHCIPASSIGLCHGRDRVWVIAYPNGERRGCLVEGQQVRSSRLDCKGYQPWGPNSLWLLPDVGRLFANRDGKVERNDNGLSEGLDRLRGCGNAVVPQIPELIGRAILASIEAETIAA